MKKTALHSYFFCIYSAFIHKPSWNNVQKGVSQPLYRSVPVPVNPFLVVGDVSRLAEISIRGPHSFSLCSALSFLTPVTSNKDYVPLLCLLFLGSCCTYRLHPCWGKRFILCSNAQSHREATDWQKLRSYFFLLYIHILGDYKMMSGINTAHRRIRSKKW